MREPGLIRWREFWNWRDSLDIMGLEQSLVVNAIFCIAHYYLKNWKKNYMDVKISQLGSQNPYEYPPIRDNPHYEYTTRPTIISKQAEERKELQDDSTTTIKHRWWRWDYFRASPPKPQKPLPPSPLKLSPEEERQLVEQESKAARLAAEKDQRMRDEERDRKIAHDEEERMLHEATKLASNLPHLQSELNVAKLKHRNLVVNFTVLLQKLEADQGSEDDELKAVECQAELVNIEVLIKKLEVAIGKLPPAHPGPGDPDDPTYWNEEYPERDNWHAKLIKKGISGRPRACGGEQVLTSRAITFSPS